MGKCHGGSERNERMRAVYETALEMMRHEVEIEEDSLALVSNATAILMECMEDINWVGFYFWKGKDLVLGPFQGRVACNRIEAGKGVCGTAFALQKTQCVKDVHEFSGHIACDFRSRSELVYPLVKDEFCFGVLDIDSPSLNRFGDEERELAEKMMKILWDKADFRSFYKEKV